jgi:predicted nucleic acid-binding protein
MEHIATPESLEVSNGSDRKPPLVFLDTSVILGYLQGEPSATQLFAAEAAGAIRIAVNDTVLQELLLSLGAERAPELERIIDHVRTLMVNLAKAQALIPRAQAFKGRLPHSNDIVKLSSAVECDFLVTSNALLKTLAEAEEIQVVTPEEMFDIFSPRSARLLSILEYSSTISARLEV